MATHDYELMSKFPGRTLKFEKGTIDAAAIGNDDSKELEKNTPAPQG